MDGGVKVAPQERNPGIEPHETKRNESNNSFSGSSVLHGAGAALHGAGAVLHRLEHRLEHSANAALHRLTPGAAMQALQRKESAKKMQDAARKAAHDMQTHFSSAFKNSSGATSNKAPLDDLQHDSMAAHVAEVLAPLYLLLLVGDHERLGDETAAEDALCSIEFLCYLPH